MMLGTCPYGTPPYGNYIGICMKDVGTPTETWITYYSIVGPSSLTATQIAEACSGTWNANADYKAPRNNGSNNNDALIGGIVGGVGGAALIVGGVIGIRRMRRRDPKSSEMH